MSDSYYSEEELNRYFSDPNRRQQSNEEDPVDPHQQALRIIGGMAAFIVVSVLGLGLYAWTLTDELPSLKQLENPQLELATIVYTADGVEVARFQQQNRTWVPFDEISPHVVNALVATEDHRFYEHWGVDLYRVLSIPYYLLQGDIQGASTITQQLARNLYQQQIGYAVSIERKLKEMITAVYIERNYTKREILEMYLNTVSFGHTSFGIESAAFRYYDTDAASLNVLQSAMLVGLLKGTGYYNPVWYPERAKSRRNIVLYLMVQNGYLSRANYERLREQPVTLDYNPPGSNAHFAPYFVERVRLRLNEWMEKTGHNIYTEGLVVHTTLNSRMQKLAEKVVNTKMTGLQTVTDVIWGLANPPFMTSLDAYREYKKTHPELEPFSYFWDLYPDKLDDFIRETDRYDHLVASSASSGEALQKLYNNEAFLDSLKSVKTRLEVGFVAIDPANGQVRAWVGGRDFSKGKYDHVYLAHRQPGSTFKPFVYTAAIDNGYSPYYKIRDDTVRFVDPSTGEVWMPMNFNGEYSHKLITLRDGLRKSKNVITARLVKQIGAERVVAYAHAMGIESPLKAVPSIALGTSTVTLLEMVSAYTTLANRGLHAEPQIITRIEDRYGNVLKQFTPERNVALSEQTAYTMIDMMRGTIAPGGTGIRIRTQFGITHDVAGKTGTTQDGADGWFILIHPRLVTGAWVGFNDQRITFRSGWWGQGAHTALLLVGEFIRGAIDSSDIALPNVAFVPPEGYDPPLPTPADSLHREFLQISAEDKSAIDW